MKRILIVFLFVPILVFSQKPLPYQVNITTSDFFKGKELVIAPAIFTTTNEYNENNIEIVNMVVRSKKFQLNGTTGYPTPIAFSYLTRKGDAVAVIISDLLFIDNGSFDIELKDFAADKMFKGKIVSKANDEYKKLKLLYEGVAVHNQLGPLPGNPGIEKEDQILKSYVAKNPGSYVAMWVLIRNYRLCGYSDTKAEISQLFSEEVKSTQSYKALLKDLRADESLMVNAKFPFNNFSFGNEIEETVSKSNYTLVDFWASYCKPCIAQLPDLQRIHNSMKSKSFAVYSVAIDNRQNLGNLDSIIAARGIPWVTSIDTSGVESRRLNIHGIPRTFLLDASGTIVATNISMGKLEKFLNESSR